MEDKVGIIPYVATSFAERGLILRSKMVLPQFWW